MSEQKQVPQVAINLTSAYADVEKVVSILGKEQNTTNTYPLLVNIVNQTNTQLAAMEASATTPQPDQSPAA
jgi:hypothetical protein